MDIDRFLRALLHELSGLEFVENVDFRAEASILRGRAVLANGRLLKVGTFLLSSRIGFGSSCLIFAMVSLVVFPRQGTYSVSAR